MRVISQFSVDFVSHSTEKLRRGIFLCCVAESFRWRKSLSIRKGGEYQDFPSKFFCRTMPRIFKCFIDFGYRKQVTDKSGCAGTTIFRRNCFVSQERKTSCRKPSVLFFRKIPLAKKFMDRKGGNVSRFSVENFLSHYAENFQVFHWFRVSKTSYR